jgi:hypothetical protein
MTTTTLRFWPELPEAVNAAVVPKFVVSSAVNLDPSEPILHTCLKWEPEWLISEGENGEIIFADYARARQRPEVVQQAALLYQAGVNRIRKAAAMRVELRRSMGDYELTRLESVHEDELKLAEWKRIGARLEKEQRKPKGSQRLHVLCELDEKYRDPTYQDAMQNLEAQRDSDGLALSRLRRADKLAREGRGLQRKAQRQIACCLYGRQYDGSVCGQPQRYQSFSCKNRYCPRCGSAVFAQYFEKYLTLEVPITAFLAEHPEYRLRILDLTTRSSGEMPPPAEIQEFERDVKKLHRRIAEYLGLPPKSIAYVYCSEFGFENCNLHCHGLLVSPYLDQKLISQWWAEIRGDGTFRVYIAEARDFRSGLAHALEYTGKYAAGTPQRAVALELAFQGCRRVHVLGWLYGLQSGDGEEEQSASPPCPCGREYCRLSLRLDLGWQRIPYFEQRGIGLLSDPRIDVAVHGQTGGVT